MDFAQAPLLLLGLQERLFRLLDERLGQCLHPRIPGQSDEVMNLVLLAPTQHAPAAEPRIPPNHDLHLRPDLAEALDQPLEHRPGVMGRPHVARAQTRHPQLSPQNT